MQGIREKNTSCDIWYRPFDTTYLEHFWMRPMVSKRGGFAGLCYLRYAVDFETLTNTQISCITRDATFQKDQVLQ